MSISIMTKTGPVLVPTKSSGGGVNQQEIQRLESLIEENRNLINELKDMNQINEKKIITFSDTNTTYVRNNNSYGFLKNGIAVIQLNINFQNIAANRMFAAFKLSIPIKRAVKANVYLQNGIANFSVSTDSYFNFSPKSNSGNFDLITQLVFDAD